MRGDIRDGQLLERILIEYEISQVYHIAAQSIVHYANKSPVSTFEQNIMGVVQVLDTCRRVGVERVLICTSDKAYGTSATLPYTEDMPLQGLHPYACSKSCEDLIAQTYIASYGLSAVIMRSGNLYGPGDLNFSRIIPKTIRNLLSGQPPVIYGNGQMRRDYTYVGDAANACLYLMKHGASGAYNVSGESIYTVQQVVCMITDLLGYNIPAIYQGTNNEIDSQWLDISKIKRLGWTPKHTFAEGLVKTIEYYKGVV